MKKCAAPGCTEAPVTTLLSDTAEACRGHYAEWCDSFNVHRLTIRQWLDRNMPSSSVSTAFASLGERVTLEKRDGLWRMEATGDNGKRQIKTVAKELDWTLDMVRAFLDARGA